MCAKGGVGAVTRAPIGITRTLPETREMLIALLEEIAAVGRGLWVRLPHDAALRALRQLDTQPPEGTASMQRDIAEGKPSELDQQTGAVIRLGRQAGIPTPANDFVYAALLPQERAARERAGLAMCAQPDN
ncbi:ketopantoate reductase family protein [Natronocella acetinitrilica]